MNCPNFVRALRSVCTASGVLVLLVSNLAWAATGSAWQSQPSWAAATPDNASSAPRKSASGKERYGISPFSPTSNNIALDVGQVFLMGDLGNRYNDSIGTQIHYTYGVSDLFGFDTSIGYSQHSDGKFSMGTLLTGLRTNLAWYDKVVPYFVFGMGFYKPSYEVAANGPAQVNSISPLLFGVHLGPGVDLELTRQLFFGAGITFHDTFGSAQVVNGTKLDVGGTFISFLLHAGVTF
ncbi:hypothetical protein WDW37_04955 [Bdellovibrionota bacterium FG-1]